jgi:hypothetical protein
LSFLLLDANVIIKLFELGLWSKVVESCDIHVGKTVIREAEFFEDEHGQHNAIDLRPDIDGQRVKVFEVDVTEIAEFRRRFDRSYLEKLDPGETEALVKLQALPKDSRLCSADAIVFRVLAALGRDDQGISLEELLGMVGQTRQLEWQFRQKFRKTYSDAGHVESIQGRGLKPSS